MAGTDWRVVLLVVVLSSCVVASLVTVDLATHVKAPSSGHVDTTTPVGWMAVIGAVVVFGSFGILIKAPEVQEAQVHPVAFQLYFSLGTSMASALVLAYTPFVWSWWGFVGAGLWLTAQVCVFQAINGLGYAVGPAIWAGLTMVVSFLWGVLVFDRHVDSVVGSVFALLALVVGVSGGAFAGSPWLQAESPQPSKKPTEDLLDVTSPLTYDLLADPDAEGNESDSSVYIVNEADVHTPSISSTSPEVTTSSEGLEGKNKSVDSGVSRLLGLVFALVVGLTNGSLMVPFHYFNKQQEHKHGHHSNSAISYVSSFAMGVACLTPPLFLVYNCAFWIRHARCMRLHLKATFVPGVITGVLWAYGNFCATYATLFLGNTIGFPLTQTAILINGLWGILYYKEITGRRAILLFVASLVVVLGGAVMLATFA